MLLNDFEGKTVQSVYLSYEDMSFDGTLLNQDKFCIAKSSK